MTKGRVALISYRLAPANLFPGPILDTLVAYASLLYQPPGSHHRRVSANHIFLAGNSAGANLCFALTRFLLQLQHNNHDPTQPDPKVVFHGREVLLPVSAGIAKTSAMSSHQGEKEAKMISFSFNCRPYYQVFLPMIYGPQNYRGNTFIVLRQPLITSSSVLQLSATGLVLQQCGLAATAKTEASMATKLLRAGLRSAAYRSDGTNMLVCPTSLRS